MNKIAFYLKKRFPVLPALAFSWLFSAAAVTYVHHSWQPIGSIILLTSLMTLFLLRIRLWDEIKDYQYDLKNHADRPVAQGLISLKTIGRFSLMVIIIELALVFFSDFSNLILFLPALIYSLMIFKNDFIFWEKKNYFFFILLHQIIFLFYIFFFLSLADKSLFIPSAGRDYLFILALFMPPFIYEIGRKCQHRFSATGEKTDDTYAFRWGEDRAFFTLCGLIFIQAIASFSIIQSMDFFTVSYLTLIIAFFLVYFKNKKLVLKHCDKMSIAVSIYGMIILNIKLITW